MSQPDFQHELADELLSAYLDDELTVAERAEVELRLANDPAAQQTLQQLRSVSQSIQRLPLESVGTDLRGRILERIAGLHSAEQPRAAAEVRLAPHRNGAPTATVFQSRRSWIWASLAVAAGLLIMALERGQQRDAQLPAIAKRGAEAPAARQLDEASREVAKHPAGEGAIDTSTLASAEKPAAAPAAAPVASPAPPPAPAAVAPLASQPVRRAMPGQAVDDLAVPDKPPALPAGGENVSTPAADSAAGGRGGARPKLTGDSIAAANEAGAAGPPADAADLEGKMAVGRIAPAASGTSQAAGQADSTDSLVVVHVLAKPAAIQNKAFDKLLLTNGINIETEARGAEERVGGQDQRPREADSTARQLVGGDTPSSAAQVDMVLVDAPESAVKSCLAGLQQDADNYASVEVEETANADRAKRNEQLEKKLAFDLAQYNRGMIPQKQKDNFRNQFYFQGGGNQVVSKSETVAAGIPVAATNSEREQSDLERVQLRARSADNRGRAVRFSPAEIANVVPQAGEGPRPAYAGEQRLVNTPAASAVPAQDGKELAERRASDSNLQVLFMVSRADEPAAGAPAEKRAE